MLCGHDKLQALTLNDTIPPVFTTPPSDLIISCDENIDDTLISWHNDNAGAVADGGEATIIPNLNLSETLDSFRTLRLECFQSISITLNFIALDSCNNQSIDTLSASFSVVDDSRPQISSPPTSPKVECNNSILDSLQNWLNQHGGALANDNCTEDPIWTSYSWNDSNGQSGFSNIGDTTTITITRDTCPWFVNVSFFVEDDCGNISSTPAQFSITPDTLKPIIISAPNDTTILCDQNIMSLTPVIIDNCDGLLNLNFEESSTQSSDTTSCDHYNYEIIRTWTASDACDNTTLHQQIISVRDTISPSITLESIVARNCDEDINDFNTFISVTDNCSPTSVSFIDNPINASICQRQVIRTWTVTDICGNSSTAEQTLQIQDFSAPIFQNPPYDTIVSCDQSLEQTFENWITQINENNVIENCTKLKIVPTTISGLMDTAQINNAPFPILNTSLCDTSDHIVGRNIVHFYVFDECDNINEATATFELIDTTAPVIIACPENQTIDLDPEFCSIVVDLELPEIEDACLLASPESWDVTIDEDFEFDNLQQGFDYEFEVGEHSLKYLVTDCGGNTAECVQDIIIRDTLAPILVCPEDIIVVLGNNNCNFELNIPDLESFDDNCLGSIDFSSTLPSGDAFIEFENNNSAYTARDFTVEFENIITQGRLFRPSIKLEYLLNITSGSQVVLKSEFGDDLFTLTESNCSRQVERILIDESQFSVWSLDGDIKFTIDFQDQNGQGTIPCDESNLQGFRDVDDLSFFNITVEYTDIIPSFELKNSNNEIISDSIRNIELQSGIYTLEYFAADLQGNIGSCLVDINIIDNTPPLISCPDQSLILETNSIDEVELNLTTLNIFAEDNCTIDQISFFPSTISCVNLSDIIPITGVFIDDSGNISDCIFNLTIESESLDPSFIGGLCLADSLKLFSNIEESLVQEYSWSGPGNFNSDIADPILTNITSINSGIYELEVLDINGCRFSGQVEVAIDEFDSPEISATQSDICVGESVILNSTSFTEQVNYFWYEGVSPNGILIDETTGPSLMLSPPLGGHNYYVEVQGENCESNPSNTIVVTVLSQPQAQIDEPFISVCEGEQIILSSSTFDLNFDFRWIGPNGFESDEQNPEPIINATLENSGTYTLLVDNGSCISDPAFAQVVVFELPPTPTIEGALVFCEGESAILSVTNIPNATRYDWYLNGNFYGSFPTNNLLIPNVNNDVIGEWSVIVEDGLCKSDTSGVFPVSLESSLNIGASNTGPVCQGDNVFLTSSFIPGATYLWEDPSGSLISGREISPIAQEGIYSVTVTTQNSCTAIASTSVLVESRPIITALSNSSSQCLEAGDIIDLTPTVFPQGNYEYEWSGPLGFNSTSNQTQLIVDSENQNGIYELIVIEGNCASEIASTQVDFNIIPERPNIIGVNELCQGENILLEIENAITNSDAEWIWNTPTGQIITQNSELNINNFNSSLVGIYTVIQSTAFCDSEVSLEFELTQIQNPSTPIIDGPSIICNGESVTLTANSDQTGEFVWLTPQGEISTNGTLELNDIDISSEGNYSVYLAKGNCNSDTSQVFIIEVLDAPISPIILNEDLMLCSDYEGSLEICLDVRSQTFETIELVNINTNEVLASGSSNCISIDANALPSGEKF